MVDTYFGANLVNYNTVNVFLFSSIQKSDHTPINVVINDTRTVKLEMKKQVFLNGICLYTCYFSEGFVLGNSYRIWIENYGIIPVNVNEAIDFPNFDEEYNYTGNDLGFTYSKKKTVFKLWAPLASKVAIMLREDAQSDYVIYYLKRGEKGVFSISLNGNYDGYHYLYAVTNSEIVSYTTDPYGKASSANGKESIVVDFEKTKIDLHDNKLPTYNSYLDTIIYELDIRDFTIENSTNIENKGKYLGLVEEGRKTKGGHPAGLDYLTFLGVTHVQILPFYDFKTIDELSPSTTYNWGYDPQQFFVPEGSYATDPNDGYSRIIECKKMIAALHRKGIKVNMDVVFNHVYEGFLSSFEKTVPGYYFRKRKNGVLCNGTGCGNDINSERPMVRKMIIDCCKFWVEEYGVDGYRFDLMGILDTTTMNRILKVCRDIKPDFMVYGEGWDLNTELPSERKASILNAFKMEEIAFFNDTFRDILKGPNGEDKLKIGGYLSGNLDYIEGFKFAFLGCCLDFVYPKRFIKPSQSINYVECHDNFTLYDKISSIYGNGDVNKVLDIIRQINAVVLLSFGIPFFHAGQEIGLTKYYIDNTYNKGDYYNMFRWSTLDERYNMSIFLKSMIDFRKNYFRINSEEPDVIGKMNLFTNLDNHLLAIQIHSLDDKDYIIVINPTDTKINYIFDDYYLMVCSDGGFLKNSDLYVKSSMISAHSTFVFEKKAASNV